VNFVDTLDCFGIDSLEKASQTAGIWKTLQANDLLKSAIALKNLGFVQPMNARMIARINSTG
jgi:hypothetical protein